MNIKPIVLALVCTSSLVCVAACAASEAGRMHVQISNQSASSCTLTNTSLYHGIFDSAPPQSIMMYDSKSFDMHQSGMGPDAVLSYKCGDKNLRFEVQQDYSIFSGQTPVLTIYETNGMILQSASQSSSVLWNSPGIINITILS